MKTFGHRGAAGLVAENTLASISRAIELGVDGIEIDVHCCKSGELVVIHDDSVDRTTNGVGLIKNLTLTELKELSIDGKYSIPALTEVLDIIDAQCQLNIELKGSGTALPVVDLLREYLNNSGWDKSDFIISSFDHDQLFDVCSIDNTLKIGVLTEETIADALMIAKSLKAYSIHPSIEKFYAEEALLAIEEGFTIYVWTVNDKSEIDRLRRLNVEAIITDFPNFVL